MRRFGFTGLRSRWRELLADEKGAIAPLAILLLPVLLGFCALVLDVGLIYANRRALQNAADGAALAAVRELQQELLGAAPGAANPEGMAEALAAQNGVLGDVYGDCTPDSKARIVSSQPGPLPHSWAVETSRLVGLHFGPAVGRRTQCVHARALAVVTELKTTKVWPWAVLDGVLENAGFEQSVVLKEGSRGASTGNFGIVDFNCGGGGTPDYDYWARYGFGTRGEESVPVRLPGPSPWKICTETGNKAAENQRLADFVRDSVDVPCQDGLPDVRCPLYGLIPILSETTWPNGTKTVHVVDFAIFKLETVRIVGGQTEITGQFQQLAGGLGLTYTPDPNGQLKGLIGIRLWQ